MSSSDALTVTVAICTAARYDLLPGLLEVLLPQLDSQRAELLIVDNSPEDSFLLPEVWLPRHPLVGTPAVRVSRCKAVGLSRARNHALAESTATIVAFIDDDAVPSPAWLEGVIEGFCREGSIEVGIVGGPANAGWLVPPPPWISGLSADHMASYSVVDWSGDTRWADDAEWFVGANIAFRRSAALAVGGFDEQLGRVAGSSGLVSNEETEIARRICEAGFGRVWVPTASVTHMIAPERVSRNWLTKRVAWQAISDELAPQFEDGFSADWIEQGLVQLASISGGRLVGFPGLVTEPRTAEELSCQLSLTYSIVRALLRGGEVA